ncbi:MAG TPA: tetratricopeptide repeat protein, partial [Pyrinomonadaceae bacterium]|nr:tetratricopeptide repeat protein [Pyrinomonadaceae bacterium]
KALDSYKRAVALRPDLAEGHYNLASVHLELGDRVQAHAQATLLKPLDAALYQKLMREIGK